MAKGEVPSWGEAAAPSSMSQSPSRPHSMYSQSQPEGYVEPWWQSWLSQTLKRSSQRPLGNASFNYFNPPTEDGILLKQGSWGLLQ